MSLLWNRRDVSTGWATGLPAPDRTGRLRGVRASSDTANRQSVVWAAIHRKASLLSSMPVDVFRRVDGVALEVNKPAVLVEPWQYADGQPETIAEWLYSSQRALEGYGNSVGIIHARDALQLPTQIELIEPEAVRFTVRRRRIVKYTIYGEEVPARNIWHERMYGGPVGLSPIAYAALTLFGAEAAQKFAADWFGGDAIPNAVLRNSEKTVGADAAAAIKQRFRESVAAGDLFVTGKDWEYNPMQAVPVLRRPGFRGGCAGSVVDGQLREHPAGQPSALGEALGAVGGCPRGRPGAADSAPAVREAEQVVAAGDGRQDPR